MNIHIYIYIYFVPKIKPFFTHHVPRKMHLTCRRSEVGWDTIPSLLYHIRSDASGCANSLSSTYAISPIRLYTVPADSDCAGEA